MENEKSAAQVGLESTTYCLLGRCSTTELLRLYYIEQDTISSKLCIFVNPLTHNTCVVLLYHNVHMYTYTYIHIYIYTCQGFIQDFLPGGGN